MTAILLDIYPEAEPQTITVVTNQNVIQENTTDNECLYTLATVDDVVVKSLISSETQANTMMNSKIDIDALLAQLSTTHAEVDQYSQTRTTEINEQIQTSVAIVLENTRGQQEELLIDAKHFHLMIENEYQIQLQKAVEVLDGVKAKGLADLERDLREKQQFILNDAKKEIDLLNNRANVAKLNVLIEAQEQAKENLDNLANQMGGTDQQETGNFLQSTTTTIIISEAQVAPVTEAVITTNEQQANTIPDNPLEIVVSSPTSLIKTETTTQENRTITTSDLPTESVQPVDTTHNNIGIETVVKSSSDSPTV